jgi:hypothetical protein
MKLIEGNEDEYSKWRKKNSDPYNRRCFTYAEQWADLLEARIPIAATPEQARSVIEAFADHDSDVADTDGITGFIYGVAVSILSSVWIHGEHLRQWHNLKTQLRDEGEKANLSGGVLNPAMLKIGIDN